MEATLVIFEDNHNLRESLAYLLQTTNGFQVIGDFGTCDDAAHITRVYQPDVVLMDIDMPGIGGIAGVRAVKSARPQTLVIIYTVFEDEEKLFQCLCAGANGYLLKKTDPARLLDAIREVLDGGAPMSPSIARKVLNSFDRQKNAEYRLSAREMEVLQLLTKGYSTKMIAAELSVAFDTARFHLKNIYAKLHVSCSKEAIALALKERIL